MNRLLAFIAITTLAACDTGITERTAEADPVAEVAAKRSKTLVCHVGNEAGPAGEGYDPSCLPGASNGWFCPDAGKIDLLEVADASKHLGNSAHAFGGVADYEPLSKGASGVGKDDGDGNGIDDGCEVAPSCPCWNATELELVTRDNLAPDSCPTIGDPDVAAVVSAGDFPWGFVASKPPASAEPYCQVLYPVETYVPITTDQADACIAQIVARCEEIGAVDAGLTATKLSGRTRR